MNKKAFTTPELTLITLTICAILVCAVTLYGTSREERALSGALNSSMAGAYPNPEYTTGVVATSDFKTLTGSYTGGTYSQSNRDVTSADKTLLKKEYGQDCDGAREIDHFLPLALGGSNDIKNLWCEPQHFTVGLDDWGFPTKDRLEAYLVRQMKAQVISVTDAQQCILQDWIACYKKYQTQLTRSGGLGDATDPDDEWTESSH